MKSCKNRVWFHFLNVLIWQGSHFTFDEAVWLFRNLKISSGFWHLKIWHNQISWHWTWNVFDCYSLVNLILFGRISRLLYVKSSLFSVVKCWSYLHSLLFITSHCLAVAGVLELVRIQWMTQFLNCCIVSSIFRWNPCILLDLLHMPVWVLRWHVICVLLHIRLERT